MTVDSTSVLVDKNLFDKIDEATLASFYSIEQFPYLKEIESNFSQIYAEWKLATSTSADIYQVCPQPWLTNKQDSWTMLPVRYPDVAGHKHRVTSDLKFVPSLFPITINILNNALGNRLDTIVFSKINPQTRILPHKGRFSNTLRCHLGLDIPIGDCKIRVKDKISNWEIGKLLILDDRLEHEAWNLTDKDRTVLIFDFIPDNILNFFPY
jgi:hypothetical protein